MDGVHYRGGFRFSGLVEQARELRSRQTSAEEILWQMLRNRQFLGLKFRRQHQIGTYIADFYCHKARLVIELDGGVHEGAQARRKDTWRDENMGAVGMKILRIRNEVILNRPRRALELIHSMLPPLE